MSLIERNEAMLERSIEDPEEWGWPFTLIRPDGASQELHGQARHINLMLDFDTGSDIQQEQASITARLSSITLGEPQKDWKVNTTDTAGNEYKCVVDEAMPDRTFGLIILKLGLLEEEAP